jgi:Mrp family chromosome partitioning ATPase
MWLQATNSQTPVDSPVTQEAVVVSMPDVSDLSDSTNGAFDSPTSDVEELASALALANRARQTPASSPQRTDAKVKTPTFSLGIVDEREPRADIAEPTTDWTEKPATREPSRTEPNAPQKQSQSDSQTTESVTPQVPHAFDEPLTKPIGKLAESIVERFPLGDPTVLTFVGSESNLHIDETCAKIASELAGRKIGRILLVDADTSAKTLSRASGVESQPGLADVINKSTPWDSTIYGRSATGLDFLAAGTDSIRHAESESRMRHLVAELKQHYQFICVAAGDAHSHSARLWNDVSDGSYLLVSIKNSNETYAKSAVTEMRTCGARLLGCVVTDVD